MANLYFKWGPYENLANVNITPGTVYVTTDEKSMYIDTENGERIRVQGTVLYYDSVEDFSANTTPPYAEDTLYFFRKINNSDNKATNAIMAYDGSNWVQINTTKASFDEVVNQINALNGQVTGLSQNLETLTSTVNTHTSDIQELYGLVGTGSGTNSITSRLSAVEELAEQNESKVNDHSGRITKAEGDITTLTSAKADKTDLEGKVDKEEYLVDKQTFALKDDVADALDSKLNISQYDQDQATISNDITELQSNKASKEELENGLNQKVDVDTYASEKNTFATKNELATKVDTNTYNTDKISINGQLTDLSNNKANKTEVESIETNLINKINTDIKAVNALTYKGNIEKQTDLPTTNVRIGDMYVASTIDSGFAAGDLFIASGEEDENGYITDKITWNHVKTGYDSSLAPTLKIDSSANLFGLYSYADNPLGEIMFIGDGNNLTFNFSEDNGTQTITLVNEWGTF